MQFKAPEVWQVLQERVLFDVRSPGEFHHGHIPGAINLPLFTDEERAAVGTTYKQINPEKAMLLGLDIVGPKMSHFVKTARKMAKNGKVAVHCWRGGKRSGSVAVLFRMAGLDTITLEGGYKSYRNFILPAFDHINLKMIILGGKTGSGKTEILHSLHRKDEQLIDLEGLAHHKGSAFGWIGEKEQPTVEQFENELFNIIRLIDPTKRVWLENESRSIGRVFIPDAIWRKMKLSPIINLEIPLEERIRHLVAVYDTTSKEDLLQSYLKIEKRLGGRIKEVKEALANNDGNTATKIALQYYDKTYQHGLDQLPNTLIYPFSAEHLDPDHIADRLIEWANNQHF